MDLKEVIDWIGESFNIIDAVGVLATYAFTDRLKGLVKRDELKRVVAIFTGIGVAAAFGSAFGGMSQVLFFGVVYAAGSIFLYEIKFFGLLRSIVNASKDKAINSLRKVVND